MRVVWRTVTTTSTTVAGNAHRASSGCNDAALIAMRKILRRIIPLNVLDLFLTIGANSVWKNALNDHTFTRVTRLKKSLIFLADVGR